MSEQANEPRISADGNFYWDGQRWAPMVGASTPGPNRIPGALICIGGLLVLIAPALPWLTASAPFVGTLSVNLLKGDGYIILVAGALAGLAGLLMLFRGPIGLAVALALVTLLAAAFVTFLDFGDLLQRIANATELNIVAEMGPGPYVSWLGSVVGIIGAVIGILALNPLAERAAAAPTISDPQHRVSADQIGEAISEPPA